MFTGIIEEIGKLRRMVMGGSEPFVELEAAMARSDLGIGDSVCVNGICLTVRLKTSAGFNVNVSRETINRTTLSRLKPGSPVNLERAIRATGRLDGHIVQGHVDCVGSVASITKGPADWVISIKFPDTLAPYVVNKGSIAVDGVSLTVTALDSDQFKVHIIPQTWEQTILHTYRVGIEVNLEADIIGRYVVRWLELTGK